MANLEQLKKGLGKYYRIQPYLLEFSDAGLDRGFLDDAWQLSAVTDDTFSLRHRELGLCITLGKDSYVNFNRDPERDAKLQVEGVLVLRSQIYRYAGALASVYTKEPGRQHREFRPPTTKPNLLDVARAANAAKELAMRQALFISGGQSLQDALNSFSAIPAMVDACVVALKGESTAVEVYKRSGNYEHAFYCNGWWFTLFLDRAGNVESLRLNIVQWRDRPIWPRHAPRITRYGDEAPLKKWERQYRLTEHGPRWVGGNLEPHAERELAEWLLVLALREPGREPKP
jgi:hypothetical protein